MTPQLSVSERRTLILIVGGLELPNVDERDVTPAEVDVNDLAALEAKGLVRVDRTTSGMVKSIIPAGYAFPIMDALRSEMRTGAPMGDWTDANGRN